MIRRTAFLSLVLLLVGGLQNAVAEEGVVLVALESADLQRLNNKDLRRLFLGLPPQSGDNVVAVRNQSDERLYQVFLQKVLFMSARTYDRLLATRAVHSGQKRLPFFERQESAVKALSDQHNAVTFMWERDVSAHPELKVIQALWQGNGDR